MSWNYRVCRYTTQGVVLFSILEVHYTAAGEPEFYGAASVAEWETFEDLAGTVAKMQTAFAKPVLDVSEDVGKLGGEGIDYSDMPRLTTEQLASMRRVGGKKMRVRYDRTVDAAYIYLREIEPGGVARTTSVGRLNLDFDAAGILVGIEALQASALLPAELLASAAVDPHGDSNTGTPAPRA